MAQTKNRGGRPRKELSAETISDAYRLAKGDEKTAASICGVALGTFRSRLREHRRVHGSTWPILPDKVEIPEPPPVQYVPDGTAEPDGGDLRRKAMLIFDAAIAGKPVTAMQMKAAEVLLTKIDLAIDPNRNRPSGESVLDRIRSSAKPFRDEPPRERTEAEEAEVSATKATRLSTLVRGM